MTCRLTCTTPSEPLLVGTRVGVARDVGIPVDERARRAVLPRPHVERVEAGEPEPVRRIELLENLAHQLRRLRVRLVPLIREHEVIGANQADATVAGRFVDDDLGTPGIALTVNDKGTVEVVQSHRAGVRSAYAPELQR